MTAARPSLSDTTASLLASAAELYRDSPRATSYLRQCTERLGEPVRIAVAGAEGAGKSTVVNALAGERIAPIEVAGGDGVFAWYRNGSSPAATVFPPGMPPRDIPVRRADRELHIDLGMWQAKQIERVVVDWPSRGLRDLTLIDTPKVAEPAWLATQPDAVIYLARETHDDHVRALHAVQDSAGTLASPVTTILVLCRADEIGAGRIDALTSAKQIARRRRADATVRGLCQNVVAVAGLLGHAGKTIREDEFTALRALAEMSRAALDPYMLSTDRFVGAELPVRVEPAMRLALLDRFGLFGVRLASTLIRRGADTVSNLSAQLVQRSGLSDLRESIGRYFLDRADVLRARSALVGLAIVLRAQPRPSARKLAADAERVIASLHDLRELRLLAGLDAGRIALPEGLAEEAERLVGGLGTTTVERLGIDYPATDADLRNVAFDALDRWRVQAESPLLGAEPRGAASVVVRSCEGMLAGLMD
jgi:hypothetical protein